jgi:hypothetical protein
LEFVLEEIPLIVFYCCYNQPPAAQTSGLLSRSAGGTKTGLHVNDDIRQDDCLHISSDDCHSEAIETITQHIDVTLDDSPKNNSRHVHRMRV